MTSSDVAPDGLKWGILSAIFILTVIVGCLPIWVLPLIHRHSSSSTSSSIVSCLSAFSGGVFLGVCLLDMIPDATEEFDSWTNLTNNNFEFPWILFGTCVGFFAVYLLDAASTLLLTRKRKDEKNENRPRSLSLAAVVVEEVRMERRMTVAAKIEHFHDVVGSYSLFTALLIHVTIEGFALGVQPTSQSFLTLFIGIALHKALVIFSTGIKLLGSQRRKVIVVALIVALGAFSFIGGAVGIILQNSSFDAVTKHLLTAILTCFSAGTFLYITFFEILSEETGLLIERISALIGFLIISVVLYFF